MKHTALYRAHPLHPSRVVMVVARFLSGGSPQESVNKHITPVNSATNMNKFAEVPRWLLEPAPHARLFFPLTPRMTLYYNTEKIVTLTQMSCLKCGNAPNATRVLPSATKRPMKTAVEVLRKANKTCSKCQQLCQSHEACVKHEAMCRGSKEANLTCSVCQHRFKTFTSRIAHEEACKRS